LAGVLWGEGRGRTAGSYSGRVAQFLSPVLAKSTNGTAVMLAQNTRPGNDVNSGWRTDERAAAPPTAFSPSFTPSPALAPNVPGAPSDPMAGRMAAGQPTFGAPPQPSAAGGTGARQGGGWSWPAAPHTAPYAAGPATTANVPPNGLPLAGMNGQLNAAPLAGPPGAPFAANPGAMTPMPAAPPAPRPATPLPATTASTSTDKLSMFGATRFEQGKSFLAIIGILAIVITLAKAFSRE
jgi:hypothetical protein